MKITYWQGRLGLYVSAAFSLLATAAFCWMPGPAQSQPETQKFVPVSSVRHAESSDSVIVGSKQSAKHTAPVSVTVAANVPAANFYSEILLCQGTEGVCTSCGQVSGVNGACGCGGACQRPISGVDCLSGDGCGEPNWKNWGRIPWQAFGQGEYIGPARAPHMPEYRVRVDDELEFVYVYSRNISSREYELQVGDTIRIESLIDPSVNRDLVIQPDGNVYLLLLGPVRGAGKTIPDLTTELKERYKKYYKITDGINLTPIKTNTKADDIRAAVDSRFFSGGQGRRVKVNPEGSVSLPEVGQIYVQGLSLDEIRREVNERYSAIVEGFSITPNLALRAPHFVFVVGEVRNPGRFTMDAPTTVMQAIALAGGWNNGGNLRQVVVFRRAEDWRLMATLVDIRGALYGKRPTPSDEIFLRDSDIVVIPKTAIQATDDLAELLFTRGIYRVVPVTFQPTRLSR